MRKTTGNDHKHSEADCKRMTERLQRVLDEEGADMEACDVLAALGFVHASVIAFMSHDVFDMMMKIGHFGNIALAQGHSLGFGVEHKGDLQDLAERRSLEVLEFDKAKTN